MGAWRDPDLHRRLLIPAEAREYVEKFPWAEHGFPDGKPYAFIATVNGHIRQYPTNCRTEQEWVSSALALLLDFALDQAMQEKMHTEYEI